jgi:serine protease Do
MYYRSGMKPAQAVRPWGLALAFLLALGLALTAGQAMARNAPDSFADLSERLSPAVVNISTSQTLPARRGPSLDLPPGSPYEELFRDFFERSPNGEGATRRATSLGSGFIIDASGIIVTNHHVIAEADEITVALNDGRNLPATVIGRDPRTDLAVLKVDANGALPFVRFGDSDAARVGDWVIAIGNPFGIGQTVTAGIISARGRDIAPGSSYGDFLQTDAAINRGNSGGPLFNMQGDVIGVNTAIISPTGSSVGIGFAIPASIAQHVVNQIREFGAARRGWLGVRIQEVDDGIAESRGMDRARGAIVVEVTDGSPAARAGIRRGDIIMRYDGRDIVQLSDLSRFVALTEAGKVVNVDIVRDGRPRTLRVEIALLEEGEQVSQATPGGGEPRLSAEESQSLGSLGLSLARITPGARERYGIDVDTKGVVVTGVDRNGPAVGLLQPGDVIVEVDQKEVGSPDDVVKFVQERARDRNTVLMLRYRGGNWSFVAIPVKNED